jgi:hypothetical protein
MSKSRQTPERPRAEAPLLLVGSTIPSVCPSCKVETPHTLMRKVGATPTRVECSRCRTAHAYRSPTASARAKARRQELASAAVAPNWDQRWQTAMSRSRGGPTPYSTDRRFSVGQRLGHASFGDGVVVHLSSSTVCTVLFQDGEHKLLMAQPTEGAARRGSA